MKQKLMLPLLAVLIILVMSGRAWATEYSGGAFSGILLSGDKLLATDVFNKVIWCLTSEGKTIYAGKSGAPDLSGEPVAAITTVTCYPLASLPLGLSRHFLRAMPLLMRTTTLCAT